ncbi:MAG: HlyD family secretion protein [Plectolyngbya sp. WJT66-NPBG17]|jgi:membrane fusion protein (multidrug efflux system)|nr:HlyD family secretion protein [Plectolyngbya sp. WJT66-NPBG17]
MESNSIKDATNSSSKTHWASKFRKTPILITSGLAIATVLSIVGFRWWSYASTHESTNDAYVTGYLHPVSSRVSGTVVHVHVDDNQKVQKGQVLVELDPKDYQVAVQNAQAALENAKRQASAAQATISLSSQTAQANTTEAKGAVGTAVASISSAQAMVNQAQAEIVSAQDQFAKAQAQEINAKVTYQRYEQLYQSGAIPKQQRDDASTAYQVAQAQTKTAQQSIVDAKAKYQSALDGIDQAKASLVDSQGKVQQAQASGQQAEVNRRQYQAAQAQIAAATASLKQAQLNLSYTMIKAPTTGRIGNKTVQVGQRIQPDQPLLAVVGGDSWIVANFNETQLSKMQPGETVEIRIDAFSGKTFKGAVNSLSPASGSDFSLLPPDNATGNFTKVVQRIPVKVTFDPNSIKGYENRITPGMSVEVTVNTGR